MWMQACITANGNDVRTEWKRRFGCGIRQWEGAMYVTSNIWTESTILFVSTRPIGRWANGAIRVTTELEVKG